MWLADYTVTLLQYVSKPQILDCSHNYLDHRIMFNALSIRNMRILYTAKLLRGKTFMFRVENGYSWKSFTVAYL